MFIASGFFFSVDGQGLCKSRSQAATVGTKEDTLHESVGLGGSKGVLAMLNNHAAAND